MMAENEYLVNNATSSSNFDLAKSTIKEKVTFKGAYHEL